MYPYHFKLYKLPKCIMVFRVLLELLQGPYFPTAIESTGAVLPSENIDAKQNLTPIVSKLLREGRHVDCLPLFSFAVV